MEGDIGVFAVDLGSGSGNDEFALLGSGFEDQLGAVDVGFDGANGTLDDEFDADSRGKVYDDIGVIHEFGEQLAILNAIQVILHALGGLEMTNVVDAAGGEIVQEHDVIAAVEQTFGKVRADETGPPSDEIAQMAS